MRKIPSLASFCLPSSTPTQMLRAAALTIASLSCTASPHSMPSAPAGSAASSQNLPPVLAPPATSVLRILPPAGATRPVPAPPPEPDPQPRVMVNTTDVMFPLKFPTSISESGDRIAGIVSTDHMGVTFLATWLRIKTVSTDKTERLIDLSGGDLMRKFEVDCDGRLLGCVYMRELEELVETTNAALAENRWRVFPCYRDIGPTGSERLGPGCEKFREIEVKYEKPRLRITHQGHVLVNQSHPSWAYRGRLCKDSWTTDAGPMAFDPETGILLIWTGSYSLASEVCDVPPDDFHAIRLPALRGEPLPVRDGAAP